MTRDFERFLRLFMRFYEFLMHFLEERFFASLRFMANYEIFTKRDVLTDSYRSGISAKKWRSQLKKFRAKQIKSKRARLRNSLGGVIALTSTDSR